MITIIVTGKCQYTGYDDIPENAMEVHGRIVNTNDFKGKDASLIYPTEILLTSRQSESMPFDADVSNCLQPGQTTTGWLKRRLAGTGLYRDKDGSNTFRCQLEPNSDLYIPCKADYSDRQFVQDNTIGFRQYPKEEIQRHGLEEDGWIIYNNAFYDLTTYIKYSLEETNLNGTVAQVVSSSLAFLGKDFTEKLIDNLGTEISKVNIEDISGLPATKIEKCFQKLFYRGNIVGTENIDMRCIDRYSYLTFVFVVIGCCFLTIMLLTTFHKAPKAKGSFPFTLLYIHFESLDNFSKIIESIQSSEIPHNQILLCISCPPQLTSECLLYFNIDPIHSEKTNIYAGKLELMPWCLISSTISKRCILATCMSLLNHLRTGHDIDERIGDLALELYDTIYYDLQIDPARYEGLVISDPLIFDSRALRDMAKSLTDSTYAACAGRVVPIAKGYNRIYGWFMNFHLVSNVMSMLHLGVWTGFMGVRIDKSLEFIRHLLHPKHNKIEQWLYNEEYDNTIGVLLQVHLGKIRYLPSSVAYHYLPTHAFSAFKTQFNGLIMCLLANMYSIRKPQNIWTGFYIVYLLAKPVIFFLLFTSLIVCIEAFLAGPSIYATISTGLIIYYFIAAGFHGCKGYFNLLQNYFIFILVLPIYIVMHFMSLLQLKTHVQYSKDIELNITRKERKQKIKLNQYDSINDTMAMDKTIMMDKTLKMDETMRNLDHGKLRLAEEQTGLMQEDVKDEIYFLLDQNKDVNVHQVLRNEFGNDLVDLFSEWIDVCITSWQVER